MSSRLNLRNTGWKPVTLLTHTLHGAASQLSALLEERAQRNAVVDVTERDTEEAGSELHAVASEEGAGAEALNAMPVVYAATSGQVSAARRLTRRYPQLTIAWLSPFSSSSSSWPPTIGDVPSAEEQATER